ncbi:hypothetical protein [Streptosporangium sp. NBC_01469]|uniref:hypothetical protein n=1 Tax=Streptosporangium sp. NBC_01469 TaxID=2903898 RepID=UPI002E2C5D7B|nr:hypothetical protein [Streptosporangium sp. NBC_01469]
MAPALEIDIALPITPAATVPAAVDADSVSTTSLMPRATMRCLVQFQVFLVVFVELGSVFLEHEDAVDKATLFIGGSALQAAWICSIVVGKAFDKLYPPPEGEVGE